MKQRVVDFLGSGLGFGFIPLMPGTMGSISVVLLIAVITLFVPGDHFFLVLTGFLILSLILHALTVKAFCRKHGKDAGSFVLDEWVGQTLPFYATFPMEELESYFLIHLLLGLALFRFFDILKPLGINKLQDLPGGWGVLTDDVLAGVYALFCMKMIIFYVF